MGENLERIQKKWGISGSTIKMTALVIMLIDHIGAVFVWRIMAAYNGGIPETFFLQLKGIYRLMRAVGRISFPLFIFLLVEGFVHTRNQWKYLGRLAAFAVISEVPFDIALNIRRVEVLRGNVLEFSGQNVFFTLSIGLLVLIGIRAVENKQWKLLMKQFVILLILFSGMAAATFLHTDYWAFGVLAIAVMYLFRQSRWKAAAYTCLVLLLLSGSEITAFAALIPILLYNGERGIRLKYVFYIFYPAHLLTLGIVCILLGI